MAVKSFAEFQSEKKAGGSAKAPAAPSTKPSSGVKSFADFKAEKAAASAPKKKEEPVAAPVAPPKATVKTSALTNPLAVAKPAEKTYGPAAPVARASSLDFLSGAGGDPFSGSSGATTATLPTKPQLDAANKITDTVAASTQAVYKKLEDMKASGPTSEIRTAAAIPLAAVNTLKMLTQKVDAAASAKSFREGALTFLDFGLNLGTLGITDFATEAAPQAVGQLTSDSLPSFIPKRAKETIAKGVEDVTQKGMEFIFGKLLYEGAGGAVAGLAEKGFGELSPEEREAIKSITTLGIMIGGFKGGEKIHGSVKASKGSGDMVSAMGGLLDLDIKNDAVGRPIVPKESTLQTAYTNALDRVSKESGPFTAAKMDALQSAKTMLTDYRTMQPEQFKAKWEPIMREGTSLGERIIQETEARMEDSRQTKIAEDVHQIVSTPATPQTRKIANSLDTPEAQFAFEQEIIRMNDENDPRLQKQASTDGLGYKRIDDPFDTRPAHYDIESGEIRLNEPHIKSTLDRVWGGDVIKVGEGKYTTVFRKVAGESFEALKQRYEKTLVTHEMAHAKTIGPEDVARIKAAQEKARATGDRTEFERIREELEGRANDYTFQKANDLDDATNTSVDRAVSEYEQTQNVRAELQALKFADETQEAAYKMWRKIARRGEAESLDWAGLQNRLKGKESGDAVLKKIDDSVGGKSNDEVLDSFRDRLRKESQAVKKAKDLRAKQREMFPKQKKDPNVDRAVRAETKLAKKETGERKQDLRLLRERITRRLEKRVLREQAMIAEAKLKLKATDKAEAQQIIVDFMKKNRLPPEVRSKFLSDLKNAKTPKETSAIIREIMEEYNVYKRKETQQRIVKLLNKTKPERTSNGVVKSKMDAAATRKVQAIRSIAKTPRNDLNMQILKLVEDARAQMESAAPGSYMSALPDDVALKIELLEMGGLKEQTLSQLAKTEANLKQLIEEGKTKRQSDIERRKLRIEKLKGSILEELTGSSIPKRQVLDTVNKQGIRSRIKDLYSQGLTFSAMGRRVGGAFENFTKKFVSSDLKGQAETIKFTINDVQKNLESIYGKSWEAEVGKMTRERVHVDSVDDDFTRATALDVYMKSKDPKAKESMMAEEGNGYTEKQLGDIEGILTKEDKALGDWIVEHGYGSLWDKLSPVVESRNGVPLGKVDQYSGSLRYEKSADIPDESGLGFAEGLMADAAAHRIGTNPTFVKSRTGKLGKLRFSENPIFDLLMYARKAEHYINTGNQMVEMNAIMRDADVGKAIRAKYGDGFWKSLQFQADNFIRGSIDPALNTTRVVDGLLSNINATLMAKPSVAAGQFSSIVAFRSELKGARSSFRRGVAKAKANRDLIYKNAPSVYVRLHPTQIENATRISGDTGRVGRVIEKMKELGLSPLEKADAITTLRGASGIFESHVEMYQKKGKTLEEAQQLAGRDIDDIIMRTQSVRDYAGKSLIETGGLKYFTQLRQQPMKIFNGNVEAISLYKQKRMTGKQLASYLAWNNVVQPGLYYALRAPVYAATAGAAAGAYRALGMDAAADKKEEELKKKFSKEGIAGDVGWNMFSSLTSAPILGDMIQTAVQNAAFGKQYEYRPTTAQALTEDVLAAIEQFKAGDIDEGTVLSIRSISRAIGLPDPLDVLKFVQQGMASENTKKKAEARKAENKTPEAKAAERLKNRTKKLEKRASTK